MKLTTTIFSTIFLGLSLSLQAQQGPNDNQPIDIIDHSDALTQPTIIEVDFPDDISSTRVRPVSDAHTEYMKPYDETPIHLQRDEANPAKLFIKGRSSLNYVHIYEEGYAEDEYPLQKHTFRGVNYEEINLSELGDGNYIIKVISNHSITETPLELQTTGFN